MVFVIRYLFICSLWVLLWFSLSNKSLFFEMAESEMPPLSSLGLHLPVVKASLGELNFSLVNVADDEFKYALTHAQDLPFEPALEPAPAADLHPDRPLGPAAASGLTSAASMGLIEEADELAEAQAEQLAENSDVTAAGASPEATPAEGCAPGAAAVAKRCNNFRL